MMNVKYFMMAISTLLILSTQGMAHSGGTDDYGCHAGTKPYHCHNGGTVYENTNTSTYSQPFTSQELHDFIQAQVKKEKEDAANWQAVLDKAGWDMYQRNQNRGKCKVHSEVKTWWFGFKYTTCNEWW